MAPVCSTKKLLKYSVVLVAAKEKKKWEIDCDTAIILSETWLIVSSKR